MKKLISRAIPIAIIAASVMAAHVAFLALDNVNIPARLAVPAFMQTMCKIEGGTWHGDSICEFKQEKPLFFDLMPFVK